MIDTPSYADALRILGCKDGRLAKVIGFASAVSQTGSAVAGGGRLTTNLRDMRDGIVAYGEDVVRRLPELKSGVDRFTRTQRLAAAHAAIVVAAYFEALGETKLPFTLEQLDHGDRISHGVPTAERFSRLMAALLLERLPTPEPHLPYAETRQAVERAYLRMSEAMAGYVGGLAVWDELPVDDRLLLPRMLAEGPPAHALRIYDEDYRSLALDSHEFGVRSLVTERPQPATALSRVAWLLAELAPPRVGDRPVIHRARMAANALDQPLLLAGKLPEDVSLPLLGEGYLTPRCRVAELTREATPALRSWWEEQRALPDVEAFLAGHLTSLRATQAPLLVLGEPGSGKTKLTEVLAARLGRSEFLPIRVELRCVRARAAIAEQIEQALAEMLEEEVAYADLVTAGGGAMPVILLDGLDELVQGAGRYDYLQHVQEFQDGQAALGRPVAVIATSRTVVADRIRLPDGLLALELQPFDDDQVRQWLDIWHQANHALLARRDLKPLPAESALAHGEMARQPLLLLLLALYDAGGNALQREHGPLARARLYEVLLRDYTERETGGARRVAIDQELVLLGAVALSMLARGAQVITDEALHRDLPALCHGGEEDTGDEDERVDWARKATERFFFVRRNGHAFLHSTFGEFLVAWLTLYALRDLDRRRRLAGDEPLALVQAVDDDLLYAVTSHSCLAERGPTVGFILELLAEVPAAVRARCVDLLTGLLRRSLHERPRRHFTGFRPVRHTVTRRLAAYSANLTLLIVATSEQPVSVSSILPGPDSLERWSSLGHLWKGQLGQEGWDGLVTTLAARRVMDGGREDVVLGDAADAAGMGDVVVAVATGHAPRHRRLLDLLLRSLGEGHALPYGERATLMEELLRTAGVRSPAMHRALGAMWAEEGADRARLRPMLEAMLADPADRMATWEQLVRAGIPESALWEIRHQGTD
ncbi:ATPase family associated with various cellular activities (AAA) [Nonomuraea solani]|uniref:ATPase family associated with various cellular activities (AAA) n=1 Tax=Nonomuraea solani TaxID=1144553 RepID=A0A1H6EZM9_9ACTN|nr:AAA family ATPase [Nonomuraea solani]SEH03340.1 ATPase family associated with various cellular activities (AAA) [Nonomuraea solani]